MTQTDLLPDLPSKCSECGLALLTLDYAVQLSDGPMNSPSVVVFLGCDSCSETLWEGRLDDFMELINDVARAARVDSLLDGIFR